MLGSSSGGAGETTHEGGGEASVMAMVGDDDKGRDSSSGGGGGGGGGELFEGDRGSVGVGGGNRWPRQETLALLKIRSDMDVLFRDSSLKAPLWEDVSRKMLELGYHRSAKKCKEKFENVYKYHKRTKDGRVGKSDGKTYRFFDQLEAFESHHHHHHSSSSSPALPPPPRAQEAVPVSMVMPTGATVTVSSTPHPISVVHAPAMRVNPTNQIPPPTPQVKVQQPMPPRVQMEQSVPSTPSSSSSTSSDEEMLGRRKKKRKWKDFFERMMKEVVDKQEELQKGFMEAVEKREHARVAREEAWKAQEIARLSREHEILVQERSMAAAKDAALISFLQKLSEQHQIPLPPSIQTQIQAQTSTNPSLSQPQPQPQPLMQAQTQVPVSLPQPQPLTQLPPPPQQQQQQQQQQAMVIAATSMELQIKANNGDHDQDVGMSGASSSRWPKAEVQALINLRASLDQKYQETGPKGPLWEDISAAMKKIGYNRNAKRCKEKWENINKYFKKVKESNKKRPQDSKTCPYFDQLDALYRDKTKTDTTTTTTTTATVAAAVNVSGTSYMGSAGPGMGQTEQQWPAQQGDSGTNTDEDDDNNDDEDEDDDEQGSGRYEIVASNAGGGSATAE